MKRSILLISMSLLVGATNAQGLIINEISQGPNGSKEFIELLVVGSSTQKTGELNIADWIVDDNNGEFRLADNSSPGIATGHFRFSANDTTAHMPIGSLIVLYNVADKDPAWTFPMVVDGNDIAHMATNAAGTTTYYIPGTSTLLRAVSQTPSSTSNSYVYTNSTVPPIAQNWNGELGLANTGDAIQTRKPDGSFYQGFGFSTPNKTNVFTQFPNAAETGVPAFNGYKGVAGGMDTYFTCGSWYFPGPYLTGASSAATPGEPNNADNAALIGKVGDGQLDYDLLNTNITCGEALPIMLSSLIGHVQKTDIVIDWTMASEINNDYFSVQRSQDQQSWQEVGQVKSQGTSSVDQDYTFVDHAPVDGTSYYRIVQVDQEGNKLNSTYVTVKFGSQHGNAVAYPNPITENNLNLRVGSQTVKSILITNISGKVVYKENKEHTMETLTIPVAGWASGIYFIRLKTGQGYQTIKVIKQAK